MIWLKTFGPWAAVLLAFVVAYQCGAGRAKGKLRDDLAEARAGERAAVAERDQCHVVLKQLREAVKASNERVLEQGREFRERVAELQEVADEERRRLATSYARALEDARAGSAELEARLREMEPGEACIEVMREVADALDSE